MVLHHPDEHSADDVDGCDDDPGHGVAAHELGGTVHGPEELGLLLQLLAAALGLLVVDQAGRQVGIDGHLLAGHGIEGEARRYFGDAGGALGDHHEVDDHQDDEHHHPDHVVAAHHQGAEALDDHARRVAALVPVGQDQAGGGDVQAQPVEGRHQQHGGKGRELQRLLDQQRRHQDEHGAHQGQGQQHVDDRCRDGQHQQEHDAHDAQCHGHVAARQPAEHQLGRETQG